ncbi:MAG: ADP-ribosylglycohydrolase family protein, partial [Nanopusillaceae archaeon]
NFVDAVNQMGYFSSAHHFAKLGIFYQDCTPSVQQSLLAALAAVGVSGSRVVSYDLGCSDLASPAAIEQAVLQFKTDGVTTATISDDLADGQNISDIASSQGFHPQWLLPDEGDIAVEGSANEKPNASEFAGAVAITSNQYGAVPANLPLTPGSQACNQIMTSHGLPGVYQSPDAFAGSACSLVWMLVAALQGEEKAAILAQPADFLTSPSIQALAQGQYRRKSRDDIHNSGYVVHSLEAALWCFWQSHSFGEAVQLAVSLGGDADTIAAICGQLAGAFYGASGIPGAWLAGLARQELISELAVALFQASQTT